MLPRGFCASGLCGVASRFGAGAEPEQRVKVGAGLDVESSQMPCIIRCDSLIIVE